MVQFEFFCPVRLVVGKGSVRKLPSVLMENWRADKILVITDAGIREAGLLDRLLSVMGKDFAVEVYDDVPPDTSLVVVNRGAELYKSFGAKVVVALGGGSVLDTAKGVCMVVSSGVSDISELQGVDVFNKRTVPFVAIPTTCGTGSEVTKVAVIEDREKGIKLAFASQAVFPDVAILDGDFVETLPAKILAATAMDALTHAVESYTSVNKNPVADALGLVAVKLIFENVVKALGGNEKARMELLVASTLAGMAFSNSMVGTVHAVSHAIGGVAGVPHGVANAILLPHVIRFNSERSSQVKELYGQIYRYLLLSKAEIVGKNLADAVDALLSQLSSLSGLPIRLRDVGVIEEQFGEIARLSLLDGSCVFNPVSFEEDDVLSVLRRAY